MIKRVTERNITLYKIEVARNPNLLSETIRHKTLVTRNDSVIEIELETKDQNVSVEIWKRSGVSVQY